MSEINLSRAPRRKVQRKTLHGEVRREAAICSRMTPRWMVVDGSIVPPDREPSWSEDLVREIAMDIGKEVATHIETMYPAAVLETGPSMLLSVRNCVFNEIIASLSATDEAAIRARLKRRKALRRKLKAASVTARKP